MSCQGLQFAARRQTCAPRDPVSTKRALFSSAAGADVSWRVGADVRSFQPQLKNRMAPNTLRGESGPRKMCAALLTSPCARGVGR
eukprot:7925375-Alexandrium_andersonii.AAC.1